MCLYILAATLANDEMRHDSAVHDGAMTALDRCDTCGTRAYVRVEIPYGVPMFCGHHANTHLEKLAASAVSVRGERERIG